MNLTNYENYEKYNKVFNNTKTHVPFKINICILKLELRGVRELTDNRLTEVKNFIYNILLKTTGSGVVLNTAFVVKKRKKITKSQIKINFSFVYKKKNFKHQMRILSAIWNFSGISEDSLQDSYLIKSFLDKSKVKLLLKLPDLEEPLKLTWVSFDKNKNVFKI